MQHCPACGSRDTTGRSFDIGSGDELHERYCNDCSHYEERVRSVGGVTWPDRPAQSPHRMFMAEGVERTLVHEIRAALDEDEPRSVYADYLIDRGDPLGTFIALQLARHRRRDPIVSVEEQALVDAHWAAWVGPPLLDLGARRIAFERGLWSSYDGSRQRHITPALLGDLAWSTVTHVVVGHDLVGQLEKLLTGPIRRSLRSVAVPNRAALDIVARHSAGLHELKLAYDVSRDPPDLRSVRTSDTLHTLGVDCLAELAPRWVERADAAGFTSIVLAAADWHEDDLAATFAAAAETRELHDLSIEDGAHVMHAKRDGREQFAITHVALRGTPDEAIANANKVLARMRDYLDPGVKLTLPSITPALAELAQRFGHKLVAAPTSFAARPTGRGRPA